MTEPMFYFSQTKNPALVHEALDYANAAHGEQKRKYSGAPYIDHCRNVAAFVSAVTDDAEMIAAAVLHDTIEDTATTFTDIVGKFGVRVARLVLEVTDASTKADGNRAVRKAIDRAHLAKSSPDGATIKLADLIDNSRDILHHDKGFALIYLPEKALILDSLRHGNQDLWQYALEILTHGYRELRLPVEHLPIVSDQR